MSDLARPDWTPLVCLGLATVLWFAGLAIGWSEGRSSGLAVGFRQGQSEQMQLQTARDTRDAAIISGPAGVCNYAQLVCTKDKR